MPAELRHRLLVVAATAVLLGAVAWFGGLFDGAPARPAGAPAAVHSSVPAVDEETARLLLPRLETNDKIEYDPVSIVRPRAGYSLTFEWPEHPDGRFLMQTNDQGFREDGPVAAVKSGPRILVLGDSHPFGLLNNRESLANVLEATLDARDDGQAWDVVNAAVSGTGPYEYLGSLRKHLALQPDLVLAVLFTGNDFRNALLFADHFAGRVREPPPIPRDVQAGLPQEWLEPMGQGFNQAFEFTRRPEAGELALVAATERFLDMATLCATNGIPFLAVVLPTKADVDLDHDRQTIDGILATLALEPEEYAVNRRLAVRFAATLRERGVSVVDLHDAMQASEVPLYWAKDYHLNVAGHALAARELEQPVLAILGRG